MEGFCELRVSRITCAHKLATLNHIDVKPNDFLTFTIHINYDDHHQHGSFNHSFNFSKIPIQSFFDDIDGQEYLTTTLFDCGFFSDGLNQVIEPRIMDLSQRFCNFVEDDDDPLDGVKVVRPTVPRVYHIELVVKIDEDVLNDQLMNETVQESMQEIRMTPASKEAIQELHKKPEKMKKEESCVICMQEFDGGEDDFSALPCDHVFHTPCIVRWLQSNHKCPLCRYALPTVNHQG